MSKKCTEGKAKIIEEMDDEDAKPTRKTISWRKIDV